MITLTIVSVIAASVAPMISKQIKINEMSDVQAQILNDRIKKLEDAVKNSSIPKGTIAFFDNSVVAESASNPCPVGWQRVGSNWNGRFPRFSGEHTILTYDETSKTLVKTDADVTEKLDVGFVQEDAIRNITGTSGDVEAEGTAVGKIGAISTEWSSGGWEGGHWATRHKFVLDASLVVPTAAENRPKSVALLGCRKL